MNEKDTRLTIAHWDEQDRPREKLERLGPQALSDAELLAILIGSGSPGENAVELMKRILSHCDNSLGQLGKQTIADLCSYSGVGPAKAVTILAACELGKRRSMETARERLDVGTAARVYNYMVEKLRDLPVEEFWILMLNQKQRLIREQRIAHGGITEVSVDVRVILRECLLCNATVLVVCHNHPSGSPRPSRQDDALTASLKKACDTMRIHLADHVVIADGSYYSYHEDGRL